MLGRSNSSSSGSGGGSSVPSDLVDYIVEAGVDSTTGYTYRKWNSGFAEAWVTKRKSTTQAAGRLHYAEAIPSGLFQIIVSANVNAGCDGQADTYVKYVRCDTTTLDVYYQNPASAAGSTYFAYITGWWKT